MALTSPNWENSSRFLIDGGLNEETALRKARVGFAV